MCNINQLSGKICQFDGFTFYNSIEVPNSWCMHSHEEIQITLPHVSTKALINCSPSIREYHPQKIKSGEALLISPHQDHTLDWQQKGEITLFYLHPNFIADAVNISIEKQHLVIERSFKVVKDSIIKEIGFIFRNLCTLGFDNERLYLENLATLLAVHLFKNYLQKDFKFSRFYPELSVSKFDLIAEYIEANLSEKITLSDLAKVVNFGKFYFCHSFKNYTNMTPYDYVLQSRVKRAQKLLRSSNLSISDVALECGFGNQSHLAKHFRKKLGTTPMNYRKNIS